jgi:hypothetical protein
MIVRFFPTKHRRVLVAVAVVCAAIGTAAGYAYAVAQTANQDYTGCLLNGEIHFVAIGDTPSQACQPVATQITWSQTGPQGPPGPKGDTGARGLQGPPGANGTNGTNGTSVTSAALSTGDPNCPNGGSQFTAANGVTFACSGAQGAKGDKGDQGPPGQQGAPGPPGPGGNAILAGSSGANTVAFGDFVGVGGKSGDPNQVGEIMPTSGTLSDLYVHVATPPSNVEAFGLDLEVDHPDGTFVSGLLGCTILPGTTSCWDTTRTESFAVGDRISLRYDSVSLGQDTSITLAPLTWSTRIQ